MMVMAGRFVIFQGIQPSISEKPCIFVIFRGGGGGGPPAALSGSAHGMCVHVDRRIC